MSDVHATPCVNPPQSFDCGVRMMSQTNTFSVDAGRFYDALVLERSLRSSDLGWLDSVTEKVANHAAGVADILADFGFDVYDFDCEDGCVIVDGWDVERDYIYHTMAWGSIWSSLAASVADPVTMVFEYCGKFWCDHICPDGGYTHTSLELRPVGE
jgi:hypothetical protein